MQPDMPIRLLIVDDQRLVREGIASLLSIQPGIEVVATLANGAEAVERARDLRPNVVLMDVRMPVMDGIAAARHILAEQPDCRIVMLTTFDDAAYIRATLDAGAIGYILKDIPSDDLAQVVRMAHRGVYQLDAAAMRHLLHQQAPPLATLAPGAPITALHHTLTERELEVLRLLGGGASNREIAQALYISEGTVKNHISSILARLSLRDRTQAAVYAVMHYLLPPQNTAD